MNINIDISCTRAFTRHQIEAHVSINGKGGSSLLTSGGSTGGGGAADSRYAGEGESQLNAGGVVFFLTLTADDDADASIAAFDDC